MNKRILLCVETNQRADTDSTYIVETLKKYYKVDAKIKYEFIYLGSKSKYNDRKIEKKIHSIRNNFSGETSVIYCIDYDKSDTDYVQKQEFEAIQKYCTARCYDFVFFYRDVEDVFLGNQANDSEKRNLAAAFRKKKMINNVDEKNLRATVYRVHGSNILNVFDKYFEKKYG